MTDGTKKYLQLFGTLIGALAAGAGIFALGFALGNSWSGVNRQDLIRSVEMQDNTIKELNEKIAYLNKNKPELQSILDQIKSEKVVVLSTSGNASSYVKSDWVILQRAKVQPFKNELFMTLSSIEKENDGNYYDIIINGFAMESKLIKVRIGDSFLFILDGIKYMGLLIDERADGVSIDIYREK